MNPTQATVPDPPAVVVQGGEAAPPATPGKPAQATRAKRAPSAKVAGAKPSATTKRGSTAKRAAKGKGRARGEAVQAKRPAKGKANAKVAARRERNERLAAQVESLHAEWSRAIEAHHLRTEAQFKEALKALRDPKRGLGAKDHDHARKALAIRLKPSKGRAKDIRHVEDALGDLLSRLPGKR